MQYLPPCEHGEVGDRLFEKELADVRAGRSLTFTLDEVERELGLAD